MAADYSKKLNRLAWARTVCSILLVVCVFWIAGSLAWMGFETAGVLFTEDPFNYLSVFYTGLAILAFLVVSLIGAHFHTQIKLFQKRQDFQTLANAFEKRIAQYKAELERRPKTGTDGGIL